MRLKVLRVAVFPSGEFAISARAGRWYRGCLGVVRKYDRFLGDSGPRSMRGGERATAACAKRHVGISGEKHAPLDAIIDSREYHNANAEDRCNMKS